MQKKPPPGNAEPAFRNGRRTPGASHRNLQKEIGRRLAAENALKESELHYGRLLSQSHDMQQQLRQLSHKVMLAQEEERRRISRELHDDISQILVGINVRLATLARESTANTRGLKKKIVSAQRLVERSVKVVHRFARELRPAVLDDLGLIPALHSYMKALTRRTGLRIHFTAYAGVEKLSSAKRTALYRVAQSALTNVVQHAHAGQVAVTIVKFRKDIRLEVKDDGKSFHMDSLLAARKRRRLGLISMRERVEMVGGVFAVAPVPGQGTSITASVPIHRRNGGGSRRA